MVNEKEAIESFLEEGTAEAFCLIFEVVYDRVRRYYLLNGLDSMTAEDLAQNVALTVYQRAGEVRNKEFFFGWLFAVARNELANYRRKCRSRFEIVEFEPLGAELDELLIVPTEVPSNILLQEWLEQIEPADRDLIVLRFVEEMSYKELAVALEIPLGTVKSRLFKAKNKISKIIGTANPSLTKKTKFRKSSEQ